MNALAETSKYDSRSDLAEIEIELKLSKQEKEEQKKEYDDKIMKLKRKIDSISKERDDAYEYS